MLSCRDVSRYVSESMDAKLSLRQRLALRFHLLMCRLCSRFRRQFLSARDAVRRYSTTDEAPDGSSPGLSPEARERIKRAIREDAP